MVEEDGDDAVPGVTPVPVDPKSRNAEPSTAKAVEVDVIPDPKVAEPVVGYEIGSLLSPQFLIIDLPSLQDDLRGDEPVPSKGLPSFHPVG